MGKLNSTYLKYTLAICDRNWDVALSLLQGIVEGYERYNINVTLGDQVMDPHYFTLQMDFVHFMLSRYEATQ